MDEHVKSIVADILNVDAGTLDESSGMDNVANWDSLRHIDICLALEQEFDLTLEVEEMEMMITFADIIAVLEEKIST